MVGIFFFFLVQDHNQGPCARQDICQKRILNSNQARFRLPIAFFTLTQSLYIAQRWYWRDLCKISKTCEDWKGCYGLTRFSEFWFFEFWDEFRTDIRLHWTAPLETDFFSYTVARWKFNISRVMRFWGLPNIHLCLWFNGAYESLIGAVEQLS